MKLSDLASKSVFASIGTLRSPSDLREFLSYYSYNLPILSKFKEVIYSFNGEPELIEWVKAYLEESGITTLTSENLGHTFGIFISEGEIFKYTSTLSDIEYVFKFNNDVVLSPEFLDVEIEPNKDFYYINNIGLGAFNDRTENQLFEDINNKSYFYPQTNHYIIKNHINYYPNEQKARELKAQFDEARKQNPSVSPWHAIEGCDCESMLAKTVKLNNLSPSYLLTDTETKRIINLVKQYNVVDGSHKNIAYSRLGGLCHYHYINKTILSI
jgi:hypothetical protein